MVGVFVVLGIWVFLWVASSAIISRNKKADAATYEEFENGEYFDYDEPKSRRIDENKPFSYEDDYEDNAEVFTYDRYSPAVSTLSAGVPPPVPSAGKDLDSVLSEKIANVERGPEVEYMFKDGFELDKAIIYSELMNPKYKEY